MNFVTPGFIPVKGKKLSLSAIGTTPFFPYPLSGSKDIVHAYGIF